MTQPSTPLIINEGKTMSLLIPIVFCAIAGIIGLVLFWPAGLVLATTCLLLSFIETGLEFDIKSMKYRKFKSLFGSVWGNWEDIPEPESFHLRLSVESHTYRTYKLGTSPTYYGGAVATSKSITYDMMVRTKNSEWIILYEFPTYKLALQLIRELQKNESLEVTDHIALKLQENQEKRAGRSG